MVPSLQFLYVAVHAILFFGLIVSPYLSLSNVDIRQKENYMKYRVIKKL